MHANTGDHMDEAAADLHELALAAMGAATQKASWGGPLLQLQASRDSLFTCFEF